jgi:hypothetical protein
MSKTLLIWHECPEDVKLFRLDGAGKMAKLARRAAGKYANAEGNKRTDVIEKLSDLVYDSIAKGVIEEISNEAPVVEHFDEIIMCGFFL